MHIWLEQMRFIVHAWHESIFRGIPYRHTNSFSIKKNRPETKRHTYTIFYSEQREPKNTQSSPNYAQWERLFAECWLYIKLCNTRVFASTVVWVKDNTEKSTTAISIKYLYIYVRNMHVCGIHHRWTNERKKNYVWAINAILCSLFISCCCCCLRLFYFIFSSTYGALTIFVWYGVVLFVHEQTVSTKLQILFE